VHALCLRLLEKLHLQLRDAASARRRERARRIANTMCRLVELDREWHLRSPRYYLRRHHFPSMSYWKHARALPDSIADDAFMVFLNYPRFFVVELAKQVSRFLPRANRHGGRPGVLDVMDLVAIQLRSYRVRVQNRLCIDFQLSQPTICRALELVRPALAKAVRQWAPAAIRMLTLDEATPMWDALKAQHGIPPGAAHAFEGFTFAYSVDGSLAPCTTPQTSRRRNCGTTSTRAEE
jgi:hypothetical protein